MTKKRRNRTAIIKGVEVTQNVWIMEERRKVLFNLNERNLSLGDLDYDDPQNITEERRGYFHRWGDGIKYDANLEKNFQNTFAIVEEVKTGQVFEVAPHCIKFENWSNFIKS